MKCLRFKTALCIPFVFLLTIGVSGCESHASTEIVHTMPAPVVDNGMTLNWGKDVKSQALSMIEHSQTYCYLDMYELSDSDILKALEAAKQRGVDVRVVVDATEQHSQTIAVPALRKRGIPIASLSIHRGISHVKLLLTDGSAGGVLIGGMNFGDRSWQNNDASVYMPHPNLSFLAVFRWDFARANGTPMTAPTPEFPFLTDRNIKSHVIQAIQQAKRSIRMEAFDLSDWDVVHALKAASQRGVIVEVLLDPGQYPNRKTANELRDAGVTIRFYRTYDGEWMHAKILDVDGGSIFIIGSANFSHQAYTYNHEDDIELSHVPLFDQSLQKNLSIQIARGTDYPIRKHST